MGIGPSEKRWPRWPPHFLHTTCHGPRLKGLAARLPAHSYNTATVRPRAATRLRARQHQLEVGAHLDHPVARGRPEACTRGARVSAAGNGDRGAPACEGREARSRTWPSAAALKLLRCAKEGRLARCAHQHARLLELVQWARPWWLCACLTEHFKLLGRERFTPHGGLDAARRLGALRKCA